MTKSIVINLSISKDLKTRIESRARKLDLSTGAFLRQAAARQLESELL